MKTTVVACPDLSTLFNVSDPKNSITPAGVIPNGQKSPKNFFFIFGIRMTQIMKKEQKKFFNFFDPKNSITPAGVTP